MTKILIVDDEASIIRMLTFALNKEGYTIVTASNGREGVQIASRENPDLIISDIMMPEMDGMEMCSQVRQMPALKNTPFIFLTAKGDMTTRIKGLQLGADDFIVKPIDFKLLMKKVKEMSRYDLATEAGLSEPELFHEVHLSGNFSRRKASEVLQVIETERLTGSFYIDQDSQNEGNLLFYKGKYLSGSYVGKEGKEAILTLLANTNSDFNFVVKPVAVEGHTPLSMSPVIMEWTASQAKNQDTKDKLVITRETEFEIVLVPDFFQLTANDDIQEVIKLFRSSGKVGDVLDGASLERERVLKILRYLISKKILKEKTK
ncbi:response regulator [bacterium]|nr:response regulator [bacterium]